MSDEDEPRPNLPDILVPSPIRRAEEDHVWAPGGWYNVLMTAIPPTGQGA